MAPPFGRKPGKRRYREIISNLSRRATHLGIVSGSQQGPKGDKTMELRHKIASGTLIFLAVSSLCLLDSIVGPGIEAQCTG
jgi:hypothetical protein